MTISRNPVACISFAFFVLLLHGIPSQNNVTATTTGDDPETKVLITGDLDADSTSTLANLINDKHQGSSTSSIHLSLNIPDVNTIDTTDGKNIYDRHLLLSQLLLDCDESPSPSNAQVTTSFYKCSNEQQRRRKLQDIGDNDDAIPPVTEGFFGVNPPHLIGVVKSESVSYQVRSHSDSNGDLSYTYAAAKNADLFYKHEGIPPPEEADEPVELLGTAEEQELSPGLRKLFESHNGRDSIVSLESNDVIPTTDFATIHDATMQRKLDGSTTGSEIDLLIYFTARGACQWLEETYPCTIDSVAMLQLQTLVDTWVQFMNNAITRSGISDLTFIKLHVAVDDSGYDEGTSADTSTVLYDIADVGDGKLENAHTLRDEYGADLVVGFMFVDPGCPACLKAAGVAFVPTKFPDAQYGFSMTGGNYPFLSNVGVHEVGHNLGGNHHRSQYDNPDSTDYSFGHADCSAVCWVTIMSYNQVCTEGLDPSLGSCSNVNRIDYFSNPDVSYNGIPTGSADNNMARQISISKHGVALNRYRGQRTIDGGTGTYFLASLQLLAFSLTAKEDITITNFQFVVIPASANVVQLSFSRNGNWEGNELNDSFWETVTSQTVTPLSTIDSGKLYNVGVFSSPFSITVQAGEQISFRMIMASGGGFMVSPGGDAFGDTSNENESVSLYAGRLGTYNGATFSLYTNPATIFEPMVYTKGIESPPTVIPSDSPSVKPSDYPSASPITEPSLDPSSIPSDEPSTTPSAAPSTSLAPSCRYERICDENDVCVCSQFPDPHFRTWNGDRYDFHNECDMIHVTNDHLDMHIRTKALWKNGHYWSGVVQAALRFDDDILEFNSLPGENKVSVNGVPVTSDSFTLDDIYPVKNTFGKLKKNKFLESVKVKMSGGQYIEFHIHLDTIGIRMDAHGSDFYESKGMTGYWNKPGLVGRDGVTSYDIPVKKEHSHASVLFATEWEVDMNRGDPILFSTPSTAKCADTPEAPPLESEDEDRRLVDMEFAKTLCDRVVAEGMPGREECIFDVLRSNFDEDVLENPEYVDPLVGIERCVAAPEPTEKADESAPSCADLGGECVYRCNAAKYDCRPDAICVEATDLTVVDAARRRMRKLEFIEGCSCALPKAKASSVTDECVDDLEFKFAIGEGVRGQSMKTCAWLTETEGRTEKYCATTMIKSACRGACAKYLSKCM